MTMMDLLEVMMSQEAWLMHALPRGLIEREEVGIFFEL